MFSAAVKCPPSAPLRHGGAYYPLNEGSGDASRAVFDDPAAAIADATSSSSSASSASPSSRQSAPENVKLAGVYLWTNATFATPVASIRVDGDLSTVDGARRCFSAAAVSACGAIVTHARGFTASFHVDGVEVSVNELGDGTATVCYRPVAACGSLVANVSLPSSGVSVNVSIDSQPGAVSPAQSFVNAVTASTCEGVPFTVRATARDARGCPVTSGGDLAFTATARGPAAYVDVPMTHVGGGVHAAVYTPEASGFYELSVKAGSVSVGDSRCVYHCVGGSIRLDGYTDVAFDDEWNAATSSAAAGTSNSSSGTTTTTGWERGLAMLNTAFTIEAWVKRGVSTTGPPPPPPSPPRPRLMEGRGKLLQLRVPTSATVQKVRRRSICPSFVFPRLTPPPPARPTRNSSRINPGHFLGDAVFAYYLAFTDYSAVQPECTSRAKGLTTEKCAAREDCEPLSMTSVKCPSDPACTPASDEGWIRLGVTTARCWRFT